MGLDGSIAYDQSEDRIYGPNKNLLVVFARGLFSKWKQPVYYGYDDKLENNAIKTIIAELHNAGLNVCSMTCDNIPSNRGIWNKLGVSYQNTSFSNPVTGKPVYCFADPPHLIKLLRNNMFDYGLRLKCGTVLRKRTSSIYSELTTGSRVCFKLTTRHLEVTGAERMNVRMAFQTISSTVSKAMKKYLPEKQQQADLQTTPSTS